MMGVCGLFIAKVVIAYLRDEVSLIRNLRYGVSEKVLVFLIVLRSCVCFTACMRILIYLSLVFFLLSVSVEKRSYFYYHELIKNYN